ncbi:MAG: DUF2088 domain-containing protein [Acholeplasmataceae bacterium]|nr:DUF2088 domain-containing protein [Acholeplasmataceae bacterium]
MSTLPKFIKIRQIFPRPLIGDITQTVKNELAVIDIENKIKPGQKIGITVGSRGIQNLLPILQTTVEKVKSLGGIPVLLAAMGSHGGGTAEGQKEMLDGLGITEDAIGAPVMTCADCEIIGHTPDGLPTYVVKSALAVDGIIVVNRVKTHTSFKGIVESGLTKKMVVGLGGPKGAQQFHGFGPDELSRLLVEIGTVLLNKLPVLGGLAIVENAYEETAKIVGIKKEGLIEQESAVLLYSKSLMPSLPVDNIDLLIIQEMGKNYSGTGIDTNIIGRARIQGVLEPTKPAIKRIAVLDLSEESHGNATGVGMADFVTTKLVDKLDRKAMYLNCLTSTFVVRAAIPMYFDTEKELVDAALYSLCSIPVEKLRIVVIPNTLFLSECLISEALLTEVSDPTRFEISKDNQEVSFDEHGNLNLKI